MRQVLTHDQLQRRRGIVAVYTVVVIVVLLGFAALTVDVGYLYGQRQHAQNTADAAALAGASALRSEEYTSVHERAWDMLTRNRRSVLDPVDQIIEIGKWDSIAQVFTPLTGADIENGFAVRVVDLRTEVPLFFARIAGNVSSSTGAEAIVLGSGPCGGIWGLEGVTVPGNVTTDSYDSTEGPYSAVTAGEDGDICSGRDIVAAGSVDLRGDLMPAFGYPVDIRGGAAEITGTTTVTHDGVTVPPIDISEFEFDNDNATIGLTEKGNDPFVSGLNMRVGANDNLTLAAGTYYFESLTFVSGAELTLTGPTTIYLTGDMDITGAGTLHTSRDPSELTIISTGQNVKITGNVEFYGSILAPYAEVELKGTSNYYGAIVGRTVKLSGNFSFHVDTSLSLVDMFDPPPPALVK